MVTIPGGAMIPRALAESLGLVQPEVSPIAPPPNTGDRGPADLGGGVPPSAASWAPAQNAADLAATQAHLAELAGVGGPQALAGFSSDLGAGAGAPPAPYDPQAALARGAMLEAQSRARAIREAGAERVRTGTTATAEQVAGGADGLVGALAPAPRAPPPPREETADLSRATYGDSFALQQAALADQAAAAAAQGAIEGQAAAEKQAIKEKELAAAEAVRAAREAAAAQDQAKLAQTTAEFTAATKAFADKKIDRTRMFNDWGTGRKIMLGISAAMSGLGAVLKHEGDKPIPVIEYIDQALREDVELQFREKDALGQDAQMKRGAIDVAIQTANQRQAQFQLAMAGHTEKAALQFEAVAQKSESQLAQLRAADVAAQLRGKSANYLNSAIQQQHGEDQQKAALAEQERASKRSAGVQYAQLKEGARQFDASTAQREREMALNYDAKLRDEAAGVAQATAKLDVEAQKDLRQRGVGFFKTEDGSTDLSRLYVAATPEGAKDVREAYAYTDAVNDLVGDIVRLRDANTGMDKDKSDTLKTATWRTIKSKAAFIIPAIGKAYQMGAMDKGLVSLVEQMIASDDPNSMDLLTGDASAGFLAARENMIGRVNTLAQANRDPLASGAFEPWEPMLAARKAPGTQDADLKAIMVEKTPGELVTKQGPAIALTYAEQKAADAVRNTPADPGTGGLISMKQRATVDSLVARASGTDDDDDAAFARSILVDIAADASRPDLANATIRVAVSGGVDIVDEAQKRTANDAWRQTIGDVGALVRSPDAFGGAYQETKDDIRLRRAAQAGGRWAVDDLVDLVSAGGDRAMWAANVLSTLGAGQ